MRLRFLAAGVLALTVAAIAPAAHASGADHHLRYTVADWSMTGDGQSVAWPQTLVSSAEFDHRPTHLPIPDACGVAFQVDLYLTDRLPKDGLPSTLHNGEDTGWLAPGGWGESYILVPATPCPTNAPSTTAPTSQAPTSDTPTRPVDCTNGTMRQGDKCVIPPTETPSATPRPTTEPQRTTYPTPHGSSGIDAAITASQTPLANTGPTTSKSRSSSRSSASCSVLASSTSDGESHDRDGYTDR